MDFAQHARRSDLEHGAALQVFARRSCAVEISFAIGDQAAFGMRSIAAAQERVQHRFSSIGCNLEHHSEADLPTIEHRGSEQIARSIAVKRAIKRLAAIRAACEAVNNLKATTGRELKHRALV